MIEMLFLLLDDLRLYPTAFNWMGGEGELFGYYILCQASTPWWYHHGKCYFWMRGCYLFTIPCAQQSASWCHHFRHYC